MSAFLRVLEDRRHPGLHKASTLEDRCDSRASQAFRVALNVWCKDPEQSIRDFARRIDRDERTVRDYRDGKRAVPMWVLLAFPTEARMAGLDALATLLSEIEAECG